MGKKTPTSKTPNRITGNENGNRSQSRSRTRSSSKDVAESGDDGKLVTMTEAIADGIAVVDSSTTPASKKGRSRSRSRSRSQSLGEDPSTMMRDVNVNGNNNDIENEQVDEIVAGTTTPTTKSSTKKKSRKRKSNIDITDTADIGHDDDNVHIKTKNTAIDETKNEISEDEGNNETNMHVVDNEKVEDDEEEGSKDKHQDDMSPPKFGLKKKTKVDKTYPPTLDTYVHRLRHLEYMPSPVTAMAVTRDNIDGYVAIAREDGMYELKLVSTLEEYPHHYCPHIVSVSEFYAPNEPTIAQSLCWVPINGPPSNINTTAVQKNDTNNNNNAGSCLIGASSNGSLWIVDWEQSKICSPVSSGGGGIFDLTYCHHSSLPLVAAACQDGSVRIWYVEYRTSTRTILDPPVVTLPSAGGPVLSIAWTCIGVNQLKKSHHEAEESSSASSSSTTKTYQTILFAAVADGTIRKYVLDLDVDEGSNGIGVDAFELFNRCKVRNQKSVLRMTVESKGRRTPTKVWTMAILNGNGGSDDDDKNGVGPSPTMTLIAGNSFGQVQFWNADNGTLEQTILQTSLKSDVLKIVVNADETKVFCSGVDSRVVCLEKVVPTNEQQHHQTVWRLTNAQRPHTHDVKALAIVSVPFPVKDDGSSSTTTTSTKRRVETLISGGTDMKLCSYEVKSFGRKRPLTWYPWPSRTPVSTTGHFTTHSLTMDVPRLLSMRRHDCVELHQLQSLEFCNTNTGNGGGTGGEAADQDANLKSDVGNTAVLDENEKVNDNNDPSTKKEAMKKSATTTNANYLHANESRKYTVRQHQATRLVGKIHLSSGGNGIGSTLSIQTSQLSENGKLLAVSNATSLFVFCLNRTTTTSTIRSEEPQQQSPRHPAAEVTPIKLTLPKAIRNVSATALTFWGNVLFVGDAHRRCIHVVNIKHRFDAKSLGDEMDVDKEGQEEEMPFTTIALPPSGQLQEDGISREMSLPVQTILVTRSGKHMVTMSHVRENAVHIFQHVDGESRVCFQHCWTLPNLGDRPASMALIQNNQIAVATYKSRLYVFDMIEKKLSPFSERHGFPVESNRWTEDLPCRRDFPIRLMVNPRNKAQLIMVSVNVPDSNYGRY
jgi:hypothetical protein